MNEGKFAETEHKMPRLERQLLLYEFVCRYPIAQLDGITEIFPYHMRMLQRDLTDLRDAGLVSVKYSRKAKGYVKTGVPELDREATPGKAAHLRRLHRLGTLMEKLKNDDIPLEEKKENEAAGEARDYFTAKDSYGQLFPGLSERTRQRDFEVLRNIGYDISYNEYEHYFRQDDFGFAWQDAPDKITEDYLEGNW